MTEEKVEYKIKEELIVNNNMDIEDENDNNNEKSELTKEKNSLIMENIKKKLQTLDITQEKIENASKLILTEIYSHPQLLDNIILMIKEKIIYFNGNGIEFLYLISDILNRYKSDSKNKNININLIDVFYKELLEIIPFLSNTLNLKLNEEINYIFDIWEKLEIYSKEKIDNLKFYKTLSLEPKLTGSQEENDILIDLITKGKYNLDNYLSEYSKEINILEESDEENKKKHRKNILKMTKDIINEQMKVYSNHIKYIRTLDSMLDKISTFKNYNKVLENNKI